MNFMNFMNIVKVAASHMVLSQKQNYVEFAKI